MGSYKIGSECCNNCVHWDSERDDKHGKENVFSYKNCAKCTSSHSPNKGRSTLAENACPYFSHIWGITKTFSISGAGSASTASGATSSDSGMDEFSRAYMEGVLGDVVRRSAADYERQATVVRHEEQENVKEPEDDFNGEAESEFADAMKELGRANERTVELVNEGMDRKWMFTEKAVEFMHMLDRAKAGDAKAQFAFAKALGDGTHGAMGIEALASEGEKRYLPQKWYRKAAEQGLAEAQFAMGRCGCGGEESLEWLKRAVKQGHVEAERELASLQAELEGRSIEFLGKCIDVVDDDVDEAISCIKSATDEIERQFGETVPLYKIDEGFVDKFMERLEQVAENGSPELQNFIGKMYASYSSCRHIVAQDDKKAVSWFERAAKRGCSDAMDNLGVCYSNGDGVDQDDNTAVQWYQKAAEAGLDWGQYHFALKLLNGEGVDKDISQARFWLQKAADQGLEKAQERLSSIDDECAAEENPDSALRAGWKLYKSGNYENAVRFLSMAEEAGLTEAKYVLGWCHYFGRGVKEDKEKAIGLFKSAAMKWFVSTVSDNKKEDGDYNNYGTSCRQVAEEWEGEDESENAAKWFRFAARSGSYKAAKSLGYDYWKGTNGFEVDLEKAVYWLQIATWLNVAATGWDKDGYLEDYLKEAKEQFDGDCDDLDELVDEDVFINGCKGDSESQYQVGCWMFNGEQGFGEDHCAAMAWWYRAAMQGHVQAQLKIADKFFAGCDDVEKDEKEAFKWYYEAAEQGHAKAQNWVGRYYEMGWGSVEKDFGQAREWYAKSAAQGESVAQFNLGKIYYFGKGVAKDYTKAVGWFAKAAEDGRADAQLFLGTCYRRGLGVEKDLDKAFELYSKAAEDQREAKFWVGKFHEKGWGSVEKNVTKAFGWYLKSAESGYAAAICAVGWAYQQGDGVGQDFGKAAEWFGKGVEKGDGFCANNLARLYEDGKGVGQNLEKALELFEIAVDKKCNRANYHLGRFYENGLGVNVDIEKAKEYYGKAAEGDDKDAKAALERLG